MRICSVDGCEKNHFGKGYCQRHHTQFWKFGKVTGVRCYCKNLKCGKLFLASRVDNVFCSIKCRQSFYKRKRNVKVLNKTRNKSIYMFPVTENCSINDCNNKGQRHHLDYRLPENIEWLCAKHHNDEHNILRKLNKEA